MNRYLLALSLVLCACSSNDKTIDAPGGPHDARPIDSTTAGDSPSGADAALDAPPGTAPLTVKNFFSWCSVSVNGGAASTSASQLVNVAPGSIPLIAQRASATFEVSGNMWHHTTGDTGAGEPGTVTGSGATAQSAATVIVSTSAKCVWVCCPFAGGTGCTSAPEQCP